jgi:hypothetical protein
MTPINVYLEIGKKKVFASAVDWPGWSRAGRDEDQALQVLFDYGTRYARVLNTGGMDFQPPEALSFLTITERHPGNSTTDFGAPTTIPDADNEPFDIEVFEFSRKLLQACWLAFDNAVQAAAGRQLRKGPRGGGRDVDKIITHVLEADQGYLSRIAWKHKLNSEEDSESQLSRTRQAIINALKVAAYEGLPESGPRGGKIWPPRYFVRRAAWHVLDHAWEIEDRTM